MNEMLEVGQALKAAREARGWTQQDAAARLRLMVRQVDAMETEDFAALGQPVFARGFVRNYARLLGLDADAILERMAETGAAPPEPAEAASLPEMAEKNFSPLLLMAIAALVLLVAVPVALYLWLNSGGDDDHGQVETPVPVQAAPVSHMNETPPGEAVRQPPVAPVAELVPPPAQPASGNIELEVEKPAERAPVAAPREPEPAAAAKETQVVSASADMQAVGKKFIRFQFDEDAWVQVRDASGRTIHSSVGKAGGSVELAGQPPFAFVVGNAVNVRMTYEGRAFDIKPYIGEKVARFTLE